MKRLPIETLNNAIGVQETMIKAYEENNEEVGVFDKVILMFLEELREYRNTSIPIEQIAEFDKLYLEKCEEVNRLTMEFKKIKLSQYGLDEKVYVILYDDDGIPYIAKGIAESIHIDTIRTYILVRICSGPETRSRIMFGLANKRIFGKESDAQAALQTLQKMRESDGDKLN